MHPLTYTGGSLHTNAYLLPNAAETAYLCIDAPEGLADEVRENGLRIEALLLTHGHSDHIWDAGMMAQEHHCPVYIHADDVPLLHRQSPFLPVREISGLPVFRDSSLWTVAGHQFELFHLPGHSPGSVAFHEPEAGRLFSGDVLFSGGIGRCKTEGLREELLNGIGRFLLPLPDFTEVYPGHGPSTLLGAEKKESCFEPYLRLRSVLSSSPLERVPK